MVGRAKSSIIILLFNVTLIIVGTVILELIFGNWINPNKLNRLNIIRDRIINYDIGQLYESSSLTTTYTRDKYGLRGQFQRPREIVILTVGGSTTDQRYITDGETWQDVLQKEFKAIGEDIIVANAGINGQSTFGHVKNFEWWFPHIPDLRPKYVLFYIGLNDFYKNEGYGKDALALDATETQLPIGERVRRLLQGKSVIHNIWTILKGTYQAKIKKIGHPVRRIRFEELEWTTEPLQISYDGMMATRLTEYAERLDMLVNRTQQFGSIPIFVTQPFRKYRYIDGQILGVKDEFSYDGVRVNGVDHFYMMRKLDGVTKSVSLKHSVLCIDLAKEMFWEDRDFYDYNHMTPNGASKVGRYLFEKLRKVLITGEQAGAHSWSGEIGQ